MPDILKVTTPLVNKNRPVSPGQATRAVDPFTLVNPNKVVNTHNQTQLLKQNTSSLGGDAQAMLLTLLKDPDVAVSYLQNICALEQIYKLLPANNKTVTPEIENAFASLMLSPDELLPEMQNQENASTRFRGELFDFLRTIRTTYFDSPVRQLALSHLLKAVIRQWENTDTIDALVHNLQYLSKTMTMNQSTYDSLSELLQELSSYERTTDFAPLKSKTLAMLETLGDSIFCDDEAKKMLAIAKYNLSRAADGTEPLNEAVYRLKQHLPLHERQQLSALLQEFNVERAASEPIQSKSMAALITLLSDRAGQSEESASVAAKTEKMLMSLLSSPCNFTPLLHFILPTRTDAGNAFAEVWINREPAERENGGPPEELIHFLVVMDFPQAGRFEAELMAKGKTVDFNLYAPPGCEDVCDHLMNAIPKIIAQTSYTPGEVEVRPLTHPRSLMEVFKSLPYKRVGVDVKI